MTDEVKHDQSKPFNWEGFGMATGLIVAAVLVLGFIGLIGYRILFLNWVDNYELAYKYDGRTGKIERLDRTGYIQTPPFLVQVHTVDLRPMQVCINANKRVLNCKLVKFNPDGLELFLSWHGRANYDGSRVETGGLNDILKSYAYDGSGRTYPFLTVMRELKTEDREMPR